MHNHVINQFIQGPTLGFMPSKFAICFPFSIMLQNWRLVCCAFYLHYCLTGTCPHGSQRFIQGYRFPSLVSPPYLKYVNCLTSSYLGDVHPSSIQDAPIGVLLERVVRPYGIKSCYVTALNRIRCTKQIVSMEVKSLNAITAKQSFPDCQPHEYLLETVFAMEKYLVQ